MNPPNQGSPPPLAEVDARKAALLVCYEACNADLQDDIRRFAQACLNYQRARLEPATNVVRFPTRNG
jgi:hypothetical protein